MPLTFRPLIVGADSKLGSSFYEYLVEKKIDAMATTRRFPPDHDLHLDLLEPHLNVNRQFNVIYLVAAITKVVDCEDNPAETWRVNADGPSQIMLQCPERVHKVFISSDAVERAPHLAYSKQKAWVENLTYSLGGAVIRPSRIPEDHQSLLDLMYDVGMNKKKGLFRWKV